MLASIPSIIGVGLSIIQGAQALIKLGKDAAPSVVLLTELFGGKSVTVEQLGDIRARNDALHSELQSQTEEGQG